MSRRRPQLVPPPVVPPSKETGRFVAYVWPGFFGLTPCSRLMMEGDTLYNHPGPSKVRDGCGVELQLPLEALGLTAKAGDRFMVHVVRLEPSDQFLANEERRHVRAWKKEQAEKEARARAHKRAVAKADREYDQALRSHREKK